jgi:hypothetical protein
MKEPIRVVGIKSKGMACPTHAPKIDITWLLLIPAETSLKGKIMETSEVVNEFAVRIAVMGRADVKRGLNSLLGFLSLCFLKKKTKVASAKEKM